MCVLQVNSGGLDGFSVGGGYSAVLDWRAVSKTRLRELVVKVDEAHAGTPRALNGGTMPHLDPIDGSTSLRVAQSRFGASGGGGVTAFTLSEPRVACAEGLRRHRLQEAIGTGDHALEVDIRGADPGRYDPNVGAIGTWDPCRARAVGAFIPAEGPGDAYARIQRERVKTGALLDTAPPTDKAPIRRRQPPLGIPDLAHTGFGTRETRFGVQPTGSTRAQTFPGPVLGVDGPCPGSYDLASSFAKPRPALGRAFNVPITRGLDGAPWMLAQPLTSARAEVVFSASMSPRRKGKPTYYAVSKANAELKK